MNEVRCFFSEKATPSSSSPKWPAIQSWNCSICSSMAVARFISSGSCWAHSGNQNGSSSRRTKRSDSCEMATPGRCRTSSWVSTRLTLCSTKLKLRCSSTEPCALARMFAGIALVLADPYDVGVESGLEGAVAEAPGELGQVLCVEVAPVEPLQPALPADLAQVAGELVIVEIRTGDEEHLGFDGAHGRAPARVRRCDGPSKPGRGPAHDSARGPAEHLSLQLFAPTVRALE